MSDVMTFSKRTAAGLEEVLRTLLLDSENKVPAERLRIVGALSVGAIIERGSNANGEYVRWADGTQVCWQKESIEGISITNAMGNGYRSNPITWTFPAQFSSQVKGICCIADDAWCVFPTISDTTSIAVILCRETAKTSAITLSWLTIGKWK